MECQSCKSKYDTSVLSRPTTEQMTERLANAVRHAAVTVSQADGEASLSEREAALSDTNYRTSTRTCVCFRCTMWMVGCGPL